MSSKKSKVSSLINQLSSSDSTNLDLSKFIQPLSLSTPTSSSGSTSLATSSLGLKTESVGSSEKFESIQFGKASSNNTSSSSSSGSALESLLSQTASGGLGSVLSGGLSSVAGIGGLISNITSLFGGSKSTPPPLVLFSLPNSIQQTAYINSSSTSVYAGDSIEQSAKPSGGTAIYSSNAVVNNTNQSPVQATADSAAIAQAVKNALLTSNTLGDVIAEL